MTVSFLSKYPSWEVDSQIQLLVKFVNHIKIIYHFAFSFKNCHTTITDSQFCQSSFSYFFSKDFWDTKAPPVDIYEQEFLEKWQRIFAPIFSSGPFQL